MDGKRSVETTDEELIGDRIYVRSPDVWPPPHDFPVAVDARGRVIAIYGMLKWDLTTLAGRACVLNFSSVLVTLKNRTIVSEANVDLLKQIVFRYLLQATDSYYYVSHLLIGLRKLFRLCSRRGVVVTDLAKFPAVIDEFFEEVRRTSGGTILKVLYRLLYQRDELGFVILPMTELKRFADLLPEDDGRQTPYIPPRIWKYQVERLAEFIADFHVHRDGLEACFKDCLKRSRWNSTTHRFEGYDAAAGCFSDLARSRGILEILEKWIVPYKSGFDARSLCTFFSLASYVGIAFILNFSLMRIGDAWKLKADCYATEADDEFGAVSILTGAGVKGTGDDICWPTSPFVQAAVSMVTFVAKLRLTAAKKFGVPGAPKEYANPYLVVHPYEPWGTGGGKKEGNPLNVRPTPSSYGEIIKMYPLLFDLEKLRVTQSDWDIAAAVTPSLNADKYGPGSIWLLAWHQLRRTGAVNMLSSGIVSEGSLQYLLKHVTRAMSLYYGAGFSRLRMDKATETIYVRTIFEILGKEFEALMDDRFVSPYGEKRKLQILELVTQKESDELAKLAREGRISWRRTLLGGCTKRGPCAYGGVDNLVGCAGGSEKPCPDGLFDRKKREEIVELRGVLKERMKGAKSDTPEQKALGAQLKAINNALKVIDGGIH